MEKKQAVVTSDTLTKEQIRELAAKSLAGIKNSYAPYSHFHVSAVLLSENGNIYTGNNIKCRLHPFCMRRALRFL